MADVVGYQQWLRSLQRQPVFINNYWCAMLASDMEENKHSDGFKIPYYIVEEELMKEEGNVNLPNKEGAYASAALRQWLVHLLKAYDEKTNVLNFEEVLRSFISKENILPVGVAHPLPPSTAFHNLPSECKLWILCKLRAHKKASRSLTEIATDPLGNAYYIVPDCRLYARFARAENTTLPIDDATMKGQAWETLYRHVHSQSCVLLCENQDGWDVVWNAFQFFKLNALIYSIRPAMTVKLTALNLNVMKRVEQRADFEEGLRKLTPIPEPAIWNKLSKGQKQRQKKKMSAANAPTTPDVNKLAAELEGMKVKEPTPPIAPIENAKPKPQSKKRMEKCWQFPQCPLQNFCPYVHPKLKCTKFPNCTRGWECLFLHDFCPNDGNCETTDCAYEHLVSNTTYYRMTKNPEAVNPRPVASVPPTVRNVARDMGVVLTEEQQRPQPTPASRPVVNPPTQNVKRCQYFPKCKRVHANDYFHPTEPCKKLAAGAKCAGRNCLFLHGPCPKDGACDDLKCIYEHYKSPLVIERINANKQKAMNRAPSMSNLSRVPSVGNLSTCSGWSRGRRKSVTFHSDSDDDSSFTSKKETSNKKGILRPPGVNSQGRCRFGTRCSNKKCEFTHPREKCPAFPKCPNGGACIFLHDVCKNDGVCSKEDCDFEHLLPHEIDNSWCKNGSRCRRADCMFLHPQKCVGRCATPDNCWKYHPPAAAAAAPPPSNLPPPRSNAAPPPQPPPCGAGPGYWPGPGFPGFGQAPPPFGFGPRRGPTPAGFPGFPQPGQGFTGPQGGYGPYPGYGPGPGGYPPGYGAGYGPRYPQPPAGLTPPPVPPRKLLPDLTLPIPIRKCELNRITF